MKMLFVLFSIILVSSVLDVGTAAADPCQSYSSVDTDSYWYSTY